MKKCFTINQFRKTEEILSYESLIKNGLYQAIEVFYPYELEEEECQTYFTNIKRLKDLYPHIEVVLHLPHGINNNLCDLENYQIILKRMKDAIDFVVPFKTHKLTLHLGQVDKSLSRQVFVEHIVKVLKELCDYSSKYQMNVMIENMPADSELGYSPQEIKEIIEKVAKDNLKFILDTGHAHVSIYPIEEYIDVLKDYLYHMHFSDNHGERDEHKRMGLGNIDFDSVFSKLKEIGYNELHCMEVIYHTVSDLEEYYKDFHYYEKYY